MEKKFYAGNQWEKWKMKKIHRSTPKALNTFSYGKNFHRLFNGLLCCHKKNKEALYILI
jgi:hypothetical protein